MREGDRISWPWVIVAMLIFLGLASIAGRSDYEDALREEALQGHWGSTGLARLQ